MAGNSWIDEREQHAREREVRGLRDYGPRASDIGREERSWDGDPPPDRYAARRLGPDRDRVFGERDSGVGYNRGWQDPAFRGVSPAMQRGDYRRAAQPYTPQDYRSLAFGDAGRARHLREDDGEADLIYGGDEDHCATRRRYHAQGYEQPGYGDGYAESWTAGGRPASGGTGGYDYERGYGDGGFRDMDRDRDQPEFGRRVEQAGYRAGAFLRRTGHQVADWFSSAGDGTLVNDAQGRSSPSGHRGRGPKGYKRSDERIAEDVNERLTDDPWLDASDMVVAVTGGEVTLSGTVEHREAKHRAERIVERVSGVRHIQNNLRLSDGDTSHSAAEGDSILGAQIRAADGAAGRKPT